MDCRKNPLTTGCDSGSVAWRVESLGTATPFPAENLQQAFPVFMGGQGEVKGLSTEQLKTGLKGYSLNYESTL